MITCLGLSPALDVTYLLDRVEVGAIHRPREVIRLAGGKAFNVARAADTLGARVRVIAPLGGDVGRLVLRLARDAGIEVLAVPLAAETRSCVTAAAEEDGTLTEFYEPAPALSPDTLPAIAGELATLTVGEWLAFSGSVPAEIDTESLLALLLAATERGVRLAIDCHGPALAAIVQRARPALVKVNRHEAVELLRCAADAPLAELARGIREQTDGAVVITDGVHGSLGLDAAGVYRVLPSANIGRFPVGSGDSFLAGLLVELDQGRALGEALRTAAASATANAAVPGAAVFSAADAATERDTIEVLAE